MNPSRTALFSAVLIFAAIAASACSDDDCGSDASCVGGAVTSSSSATASTGGGGATSSSGGGGSASTSSTGGATSTGGGGSGGANPGAHGSCVTPKALVDGVTVMGDTTGGPTNLDDMSCEQGGSAEDVYEVTATTTGVLVVTMTSDGSTNGDLGVYARAECQAGPDLACADDANSGFVETLEVAVTAGDKVYLVVDGYNASMAAAYSLTATSRAVVCGDGQVDPPETCDPPSAGTCDASCQIIPEAGHCDDGIDNDGNGYTDCEDAAACATDASCPLDVFCAAATPLLASQNATNAGGANDFVGGCLPGGGLERIYDYVNAGGDEILAVHLDTSSLDFGLYQRASCDDATSELACCFAPGAAVAALPAAVPAGSAQTFFVDGGSATDVGNYLLVATSTPTNEGEPNDDSTQAKPVAIGATSFGIVYPALDVDWFAVTLGPAQDTLDVAVGDLGTGACDLFSVGSDLTLYDKDATTVLDDSDASTGEPCPETVVTGLTPGATYFFSVKSSSLNFSSPSYGYSVTAN